MPDSAFTKPKVLLIADPESPAQALARPLEAAGYAITRATTGEEALEIATDLAADLILVDAALPDIPGLELCRALLRERRAEVTTPFLLYTSHAPTREERLAALPAGVRGFIGPWVETDLILQEFDAQLQAKREGDRNLTEALVDPSSGLYNRRGLVRRVRELGAQAMRMHQGLACLVFELDAESEEATPARAVRWFRGVQSTARLSDVTGRLGPREFAVIAPATDAAGAVRLAERVAAVVRETAEKEGLARDTIRIRAGYEAVANLGYTPVEPVALLLRATSALHSGESEPQINWVRRFPGDRKLH